MNEKAILIELDADLQLTVEQKVIYLEGKTDVEVFFGLIGVAKPASNQHQGVLVKGVGGGALVENRIITGQKHRPGCFYGLLDGDGRSYIDLAGQFDPPHPGPLFAWKTYCIENLLVKTGWPTIWGDLPDWNAELAMYAPYVALNRIHLELMQALETLDLAQFSIPSLARPLKTADELRVVLSAGKHLIHGYNVESRFNEEHEAFLRFIDSDQNEIHARLNGKWLVTHLAAARTQRSPDTVRNEWAAHARSNGGLPEVCDLWQRITGNPPY